MKPLGANDGLFGHSDGAMVVLDAVDSRSHSSKHAEAGLSVGAPVARADEAWLVDVLRRLSATRTTTKENTRPCIHGL